MVFAFIISDETNSILIYFANLLGSGIKNFQTASFYLVGLLAGSVMGATQSTSRSMMTKLTPKEKKTEFFGFYSLFGKSSAIIGPLVFGIISYVTENQSYAILSISVFFVIGLYILRYVTDGVEQRT